MRGLYLHIPFCKTRCHYCNFVTTAAFSSELKKRFFQALFAEIKHARSLHGPLSFDTLYFGGGTPSCLEVSEIANIVSALHAPFQLGKAKTVIASPERARRSLRLLSATQHRADPPLADASFARNDGLFSEDVGFEFTCEWNPGDAADHFQEFSRIGINRISLGCQAFQDEMLQRIGRRHTVQDIEDTISRIRQAGIDPISFDLMLRLPGQTVQDFRASVERSIELQASQVSLYDLEVHFETPFGALERAGKLTLPSEEEHAQMYETAIQLLTGAGYEHYEISNFAKPGMASRHNLLYWNNQEYLGLGPGAFSYLNGIRSQRAPGLGRYLEKCENGDWTNDLEEKLTEEEKETETLVMKLRLAEGIDPASFPGIYPALQNRVDELMKEKLLENKNGKIRLTTRGQFLSEDAFRFLIRKEH